MDRDEYEPDEWERGADERARALRTVLETFLLDVLAKAQQRPHAVLADERVAWAEHYKQEIDAALPRFGLMLERARGATISAVASRLHAAEGADHEMIDQAVEYALSGPIVTRTGR